MADNEHDEHDDAVSETPKGDEPSNAADTADATDTSSKELGTSGDGDGDGDGDDIWSSIDAGEPRQQAVRIAQIGLVVLVLLIVGIVVLTKRGGDDDESSKKDDSTEQTDGTSGTDAEPAAKGWPAEVRGRPAGLGTTKVPAGEVTPTAEPGAYIWSDFDGWHLWVVNGAGVPAITGTLTSNDNLGKAVLAIEDAGEITLNGKSATFTLPTDRPLVGIDFNPGFYANKLVFTLNGPDGAPLDGALIKTGSKSAAAPFPIVIEMVTPDS